jgi:multidrug efflux pump subunit AcrA (membrane-fusion protein)
MKRPGSVAVLIAALACGCRSAPQPSSAKPEQDASGAAGTPVRVVSVTRATLAQVVTATGHTLALVQSKLRAPFAGSLMELAVTDGDLVQRGQEVGALVSRDSEAALAGAREMLREAQTPQQKRDAERALALAETHAVRAALTAPAAGMVLSHAASAGDRVSEDQEILAIAATDSLVFQADVAQNDLAAIQPGQKVSIDTAGRSAPLVGQVHGVLGAINAADLTLPVRIDLMPRPVGLPVGLFGTAHITVAVRRDAAVLPRSAILRDDLTGLSRVATVTAEGHAHWVEVKPGLVDGDNVELLAPDLGAARVIVSGLVGLPEDAPVAVQP